jgi:hypothetical protein
MSKQVFRERECIHRDKGADGEFFNGVLYVKALGRFQIGEAMEIASMVSPFFWVDAPHILVWLCDGCAGRLHLTDTPRSIVQGVRRQA